MRRYCMPLFAAFVAAGLFLSAQTARADAIDDVLARVTTTGQILKQLRAQGYKNVGILRFQVQDADGKPTFHAGHLNDIMATRLENALIVRQPVNKAKLIGITRGATAAAVSQDKKANYTTAAGRAKLFQHKYPLAWGDQAVRVDAFLTGIVQLSPDSKTTKIIVQAFDREDPAQVKEIVSMEPSTDRAVLRDMGKSFVISKRSMFLFAKKGEIPDAEVDDNLPELVEKPADNLKTFKEYLDVQIKMGDRLEGTNLVNGAPLNIVPDGDGHGKIDGLAEGKNIVITMKSKVPLGVLLRVNGVNTVNEERYEKNSPYEYSWWVLEPNKEYQVRGFINRTEDGRTKLKEFKVKSPEDVLEGELGEDVSRWGKIEFEIFADEPALGLEPKIKLAKHTTDFLRREHPPASDFASAKNLIAMARSEVVPPAGRLFISSKGEGRDINVETTDFTGTNVGRLEIRYYYPGMGE